MSFVFFRSGNYIIGKKEKIEIAAIIKNGGEDAFNARFFLQVTNNNQFRFLNIKMDKVLALVGLIYNIILLLYLSDSTGCNI